MRTPTMAVFEPQRYLLAKVMQYKSPLLVFMRAVSRGFVFTCWLQAYFRKLQIVSRYKWTEL